MQLDGKRIDLGYFLCCRLQDLPSVGGAFGHHPVHRCPDSNEMSLVSLG